MPFVLEHQVVSRRLDVERHEGAGGVHFTVAAQGSFEVLHPGPLLRQARASVRHSMRIDVPDIDLPDLPATIDGLPSGLPPRGSGGQVSHPLHNGVQVSIDALIVNLRIFDPDGRAFSAESITVDDLGRFRDRSGKPRRWSYVLNGSSRTYVLVDALNETVGEPEGALNLTISETIASTSAAPLVSTPLFGGGRQRMTFELNRVGTFVANVGTGVFDTWRGTMRLLDPAGTEAGRTASSELRCAIPLSRLGPSRDAAGNPRLWTLEVSPRGGVAVGPRRVTATVLGEGRLRTPVLRERIQRIFGPDGTLVTLSGVDSGGYAEAYVTIQDLVAAETLDMHNVLDARLKSQGEPTDVVPFQRMRVYRRSADLGYNATVEVGGITTTRIDVAVGPSVHLRPGTPALRVRVDVRGAVRVKWGPLTLATAHVRGGSVEVEVGIRIEPDGTPRFASWFPDRLFDIDFHPDAIAAFVAAAVAIGGAAGGPPGALLGLIGSAVTTAQVEDVIERYLNDDVAEGAKKLFDDPTLPPRILMTMLGTHLTYRPTRFEGEDILFEHVAPLEPDPSPRDNYAGAIGRTLIDAAVGHTMFRPPSLGDTWAAGNLRSKIKRIVVVMMENRSYDHVLGYRSISPSDPRDRADGWTPELIAAVNARAEQLRPPPPPPPPAGQDPIHVDANPPVGPIRNSAFDLNHLGLRTRLPLGVGHELADVAQQLGERMDGPGGRRINDPSGFVNNFREHRLRNNPYGDQEKRVVPFDVLRYYEKRPSVTDPNTGGPVDELPMYGFLAEEYGYCDRYFCSHPGPTLPNRMFSLTGDLQHDRYGFPILDNNHSDNFLLSRAQTIYDVLTRHGVSWRVYESSPSVTMLRMFARYASDDVNIRPLEDFFGDASRGELPSFVAVEPAMHHYPQDDDHPDADMSRGQRFIWRVYEALTADEASWNETLLLITYDEHGGFYDHVIPPIADVFEVPRPDVADPGRDPVVGVGGARADRGGPVGGGVRGDRDDVVGTRRGGQGGVLGQVRDRGSGSEPSRVEEPVHVPYGVRVPTFVVSPWTPPGKGPSITLDHCSIVKTVLATFCGDTKPFFSDRVNASLTLDPYLSEPQPRVVGAPPEPADIPITAMRLRSPTSRIITEPLFRRRMREEQVDYHEISGRLARMLGR